MKTPLLLSIIVCLFLLSSCHDYSVRRIPEMERAERLMNEYPDSARRLLNAIKNKVWQKRHGLTWQYYEMLLVKADDNCHIRHSSDIVMLSVVHDFSLHGIEEDKMEAFYLMGRVYTDMECIGSAIEYYNKALEINCADNKRIYQIRGCANNQIGQIYFSVRMPNEALPFFRKSLQYAYLAKDTALMKLSSDNMKRCVYAKFENQDTTTMQTIQQKRIHNLMQVFINKSETDKNNHFLRLRVSYEMLFIIYIVLLFIVPAIILFLFNKERTNKLKKQHETLAKALEEQQKNTIKAKEVNEAEIAELKEEIEK